MAVENVHHFENSGIFHGKSLLWGWNLFCRFLFWLAGETAPSIQRAYVTGQKKSTLIKMAEQAKALTIDRQQKRLFWVQSGLQGESAVASCDYNGNTLHILDISLEWVFCCIVIPPPPFVVFCTEKICFCPFPQGSVRDISFSAAYILHWQHIRGYKASKQAHWRRDAEC